jgi:hypothetical protein
MLLEDMVCQTTYSTSVAPTRRLHRELFHDLPPMFIDVSQKPDLHHECINSAFKTITLLIYTSLYWTRVAMGKWQKQETESRHRESWMIKDRQCTYNVTLRRVRVTTVTVESSKYYILWVRFCGLSYPARNAHAPYYTVTYGLSGSTAFLYIIS